jgi:hypothetical protein
LLCEFSRRGYLIVGLAYRARFAGTLYFLFGFEKSDRDNITRRELGIYQGLASTLVVLNNAQIETALKANELMEVQHEPND